MGGCVEAVAEVVDARRVVMFHPLPFIAHRIVNTVLLTLCREEEHHAERDEYEEAHHAERDEYEVGNLRSYKWLVAVII